MHETKIETFLTVRTCSTTLLLQLLRHRLCGPEIRDSGTHHQYIRISDCTTNRITHLHSRLHCLQLHPKGRFERNRAGDQRHVCATVPCLYSKSIAHLS